MAPLHYNIIAEFRTYFRNQFKGNFTFSYVAGRGASLFCLKPVL